MNQLNAKMHPEIGRVNKPLLGLNEKWPHRYIRKTSDDNIHVYESYIVAV